MEEDIIAIRHVECHYGMDRLCVIHSIAHCYRLFGYPYLLTDSCTEEEGVPFNFTGQEVALIQALAKNKDLLDYLETKIDKYLNEGNKYTCIRFRKRR